MYYFPCVQIDLWYKITIKLGYSFCNNKKRKIITEKIEKKGTNERKEGGKAKKNKKKKSMRKRKYKRRKK